MRHAEHARHLPRMGREDARRGRLVPGGRGDRPAPRARRRRPPWAGATSATSARARAWVSGSSEIPGPSATASRCMASSRRCSRALTARDWAAVSTMGSVMVSMLKPATMGCWDAGVAMVQRPTPLLSADRPASAAAPVLPTEPAIDEEMTVAALVRLGRSRREERSDIGLLEQERADAAIDLGLRGRRWVRRRHARVLGGGIERGGSALGPRSVAVSVARTAGPRTAPPSEPSPEGRSRATTGSPARPPTRSAAR